MWDVLHPDTWRNAAYPARLEWVKFVVYFPSQTLGCTPTELQVVSRVAVTKCLACAEAEIYDLSKHFWTAGTYFLILNMYKDAEKGENGIVRLHVRLGMFYLFQVLYFV